MTIPISRRDFLTGMAFAGWGGLLGGYTLGRYISHPHAQLKNTWSPKLSQFEQDLATAAIAIDTLWGGNYKEESGADHLIVDAYCSGKEEPIIASPELQQLFLKEGVKVTDKNQIKAFLKANQVEEGLSRLQNYANCLAEPWRKEFLSHLITTLETQLALRLNLVGEGTTISDEQAYRVALGKEPKKIPTEEIKEKLFHYLERLGFQNSHPSYKTVDEWRNKSLLTGEELHPQWWAISKKLNQLTKEKIFPFLPGWITEIPEESIDFDIIRKPVHYSGINLALHTIKNGKPVYHTRIRISNAVKTTPAYYKIGLVAHEGLPGHGLHTPFHHGLYAQGINNGFESTLNIMCSPGVALDEGVATSAMNLLYGNNLEEELSLDELVAYCLNDLNVYGRNNVVVAYLNGEKDKAKLAEILHEEYFFSEVDSHKYVDNWLFNEKMGKLLGLMYLPAYGVSRQVVKEAIDTYGREKTIPVVYGANGELDVISFPKRMKELYGGK